MVEPLRPDDPRQVGQYRLEGVLGAGGMGQVYLGRSPSGWAVAVKVVHAELARDTAFCRRFAEEISAARKVSGMFTAPVVDADPDARPPWLATAYIAGPSLQQAVDRHGPLPGPAVTALGAKLAEGLAAVHNSGVVHRDLKPANVILASDGPRVIDFGIAQALDVTSALTPTLARVGTPAFMSPEQARGETVGRASDVFSLGGVLVFAATGRPPFGTGLPDALLYRVVNEAPNLTGLPAGLVPLVTACLARKPADRPTLTEIIDRLTARLDDPTLHLPPGVITMIDERDGSTNAPEPPPPAHQNTLVTAAIAAVAAALLAALVVYLTVNPGTGHARTSPTDTPSTHTPTPLTYSPTPLPPFNPATLDSQATDQTPQTTSALLPQTFPDPTGGTFGQTSTFIQPCPFFQTGNVQAALTRYHCTQEIMATYLGRSSQIETSVWLIPMADSQTATAAYDAIRADWNAPAWGLLCPGSGPGYDECHVQTRWASATEGAWIGHCHRYLMAATSIYLDLRTDSGVLSGLNAVAGAAGGAFGPQNVAGAHCW